MPTGRTTNMQVVTINLEGNMLMKKIIVTIACCAMIAPLAIAKEKNGKSSKKTRATHVALVTQPGITVTAPSSLTRSVEGVAAAYQPANALVINYDGPGAFVLNDSSRVFNRRGEVIRTRIRPGAFVQVVFASDEAGRQTIDHVVVY